MDTMQLRPEPFEWNEEVLESWLGSVCLLTTQPPKQNQDIEITCQKDTN